MVKAEIIRRSRGCWNIGTINISVHIFGVDKQQHWVLWDLWETVRVNTYKIITQTQNE